MMFFGGKHSHEHLQPISRAVAELAEQMEALLPLSPEKTTGLRKLLKAKDGFVRANMPMPKEQA